ncbi:DNA-directed RNA polymerase, subunit K/omega [Ekhidna lutea]|uniref:DNA-directed RNA polymerase subunit omega n=1 Tax=Ekhidna lutea TaxID=447679 RepID=A0A239M4B7_EKHLU|nr:DNA-directed RNA polymerase subunit omega [Ekhidna lutea]SNT37667.1 DNA-directed RNA polymerase, subunit K/omega [Ekhidna lutea]
MQHVTSSLITRDNQDILEPTGNLYESLVIIAKRARQISANQKEELNAKLAEFASSVDNLEEIFENREQIEISKFYERMPKPTTSAIEEFLNGELNFRLPEEEDESRSDLA